MMGIQAAGGDSGHSFAVQPSKSTRKGGMQVHKGRMFRISCKSSLDFGWGVKDKAIVYRAQMDSSGVLVADTRFRIEIIDAPIRRRNHKNGASGH
jgi:hypothetical protein